MPCGQKTLPMQSWKTSLKQSGPIWFSCLWKALIFSLIFSTCAKVRTFRHQILLPDDASIVQSFICIQSFNHALYFIRIESLTSLPTTKSIMALAKQEPSNALIFIYRFKMKHLIISFRIFQARASLTQSRIEGTHLICFSRCKHGNKLKLRHHRGYELFMRYSEFS